MNGTKAFGWLPMAALALALAGILAFVFARTQAVDASSYFENEALLRQVKQLDARWELDVLKSRIGIDSNYDALVDPLSELKELEGQLRALPANQRHSGAATLASASGAFYAAFDEKMSLIEDFKSHNSILRNSLSFLPTASADFRQAALDGGRRGRERLEKTAAGVNQVLLDSLVYSEAPSDNKAAEIRGTLDRLAADDSDQPSATRESLNIFASHARTVLREQPLVNGLLRRIADVPLAARVDALNGLLSSEKREIDVRARRDRLHLLVFAAALALLLLYAAITLMRNHAVIKRVNHDLHDSNATLEQRVSERTVELTRTNEALAQEISGRKNLEVQLVQSEKLASIGQLAAGVAHEINNPIGFVQSNLNTLDRYLKDIFALFDRYREAEPAIADASIRVGLDEAKRGADLEFVREDVSTLLAQSRDGITRVTKIVRDLKNFSRSAGDEVPQLADLHDGIDTTLNIVMNEIKYKAEIVKEYGELPAVQCRPSQLNQVFMNMLVNGAHAIKERGRIVIRTGSDADNVWIEFEDTGQGISPEHINRIFDPFFTTKAIGKGTGLGLSMAYGIVKEHGGRIDVRSVVGEGTTFRIWLPLVQKPVLAVTAGAESASEANAAMAA